MYDYYDLLGVDRNADAETIEAAFREQVRQHHPDREGDSEEVLKLKRAREVLTDPALRKDYDRLGHREFVERERGGPARNVDLRSGNDRSDGADRKRSRAHTRPRDSDSDRGRSRKSGRSRSPAGGRSGGRSRSSGNERGSGRSRASGDRQSDSRSRSSGSDDRSRSGENDGAGDRSSDEDRSTAVDDRQDDPETAASGDREDRRTSTTSDRARSSRSDRSGTDRSSVNGTNNDRPSNDDGDGRRSSTDSRRRRSRPSKQVGPGDADASDERKASGRTDRDDRPSIDDGYESVVDLDEVADVGSVDPDEVLQDIDVSDVERGGKDLGDEPPDDEPDPTVVDDTGVFGESDSPASDEPSSDRADPNPPEGSSRQPDPGDRGVREDTTAEDSPAQNTTTASANSDRRTHDTGRDSPDDRDVNDGGRNDTTADDRPPTDERRSATGGRQGTTGDDPLAPEGDEPSPDSVADRDTADPVADRGTADPVTDRGAADPVTDQSTDAADTADGRDIEQPGPNQPAKGAHGGDSSGPADPIDVDPDEESGIPEDAASTGGDPNEPISGHGPQTPTDSPEQNADDAATAGGTAGVDTSEPTDPTEEADPTDMAGGDGPATGTDQSASTGDHDPVAGADDPSPADPIGADEIDDSGPAETGQTAADPITPDEIGGGASEGEGPANEGPAGGGPSTDGFEGAGSTNADPIGADEVGSDGPAAAGPADADPISPEEVGEDPATEDTPDSAAGATDGGFGVAGAPEPNSSESGGPGIVSRAVGAVLAIPAGILAAIPSPSIGARIDTLRAVFGSGYRSDAVDQMARYAWLGRAIIAGVLWALLSTLAPGTGIVPSSTPIALGAVLISLGVAFVAYDLLLWLATDLEPGCHGPAEGDAPIAGTAGMVALYLLAVGTIVGVVVDAPAIPTALLETDPTALSTAVVANPYHAAGAVLAVVLGIVSVIGLFVVSLYVPWSDRFDRGYRVVPGLWQLPLPVAVAAVAWAVGTGGTIATPVQGVVLDSVAFGAVVAALPLVAAAYLVRRRLAAPTSDEPW